MGMEKGSDTKTPTWCGLEPRRAFAVLGVGIAAVVLALVLGLTIGLLGNRDAGSSEASDPSIPRANLGYAVYRGTLVGDSGGVAQYLGIQYAKAPVGDLRFRAPVAPDTRWTGEEVKANKFGPVCLGISEPYPNADKDEDCLYANVWAPANATVESKLPVWLFIQGGGYTLNSSPNWNGTYVVQRSGNNIVFVNFNYRVGLFGFLASERVRTDGDLNAGLLDQRFVIRWLRQHVAQFGGDPDHIVVHGASAGAGSVALHLVANGGNATDPESGERLFAGAVGESVFFPAQPFVHELEWQFNLTLQRTGCDAGADDAMTCLRGKSTEDLQTAANIPATFPGAPDLSTPLFFWTPCIDGDLLQDLPYLLFERGQFIDVPVIMGSTTDEGTVFAANAATTEDMTAFLQSNYPLLSVSNTSAILEQYPQLDALPNHSIWFPSTARAYGETTFICPGAHILNSYVRHLNTSRAWGYHYDVHDADNIAAGLGVPHVFSSWAIFGPDSEPGTSGPQSYHTYNAGVVPIMMDYWISFVRTLDPSPLRSADSPPWQSWGPTEKRLLVQTGNVSTEVVSDDQEERCTFWKTLAPVMRQ